MIFTPDHPSLIRRETAIGLQIPTLVQIERFVFFTLLNCLRPGWPFTSNRLGICLSNAANSALLSGGSGSVLGAK